MKTKAIIIVIFLLAACGLSYFFLRAKWRNEEVAIQEIEKIISNPPHPPSKKYNPEDPPLNPNLWYDDSLGLDLTIRGIDQGVKEIEQALSIGYRGNELLPLIRMPVDLLDKKSKSGDAASQYVMCVRKKLGLKSEKAPQEYRRLLDLSSESKYPIALREKALNLKNELKDNRYTTSASKFILENLLEIYMTEASELGDPIAMYNLAAFYYFSNNKSKSQMLFEKCLTQNEIKSSFLCHKFFVLNIAPADIHFVIPNNLIIEDSYKYIINLADSGVPAAQEALANICSEYKIPEKNLGTPREDAAFKWHLKAAKSGRMNSQKFIGEAYLAGRIIPKNSSESAKWLELAADQGAYSASLLGERYLKGLGFSKDYKKSIRWMTIGAIYENNKNSQYNIGQCYWNGLGVPRNLLVAYAWINVANTSGFHAESLSTLKGSLSVLEISKAEDLSRKIFELIQNHKLSESDNVTLPNN